MGASESMAQDVGIEGETLVQSIHMREHEEKSDEETI